MTIDRRSLLAGIGAAGTAGIAGARAQTAPAVAPPAQTQGIEARLLVRALENLHPIAYDGNGFSGAGWDLLVREGRASEFALFGEEHGLHEAPILARHWFDALRPAGYDTLAVEISPPIAEDLDVAARGGVEGIRRFVTDFPPGPAFYFWRSEAELIAAVRASIPGPRPAIWGLDYEIAGDRRLIARLKAKVPRGTAATALAALESASSQAWATWARTHNPGALFTFSGNPALVRALRDAWPRRDADATRILETLEETLEINALFGAGKAWESNERRAHFIRANLAAHLNRAAATGRKPKAMIKMGENHLQRGVNWTGNFDAGSLAVEVATMRGGKAFSVLVGAGDGGRHGVLNPTNMSVADAPGDMFRQLGFGFVMAALKQPGPVLLDTRPLRRYLSASNRLQEFNNPEAVRNIFGYDALIFWNGSTATRMLVGS